MHAWTKRALALAMVVVLVFTVTGVPALAQDLEFEEEPSAVAMIADLVFLRPLGFAAFLVGTAFFIVSLPFSWPSGSTGVAMHKLMEEPASFTFARPLGKVNN